jgi:hypothetical protein
LLEIGWERAWEAALETGWDEMSGSMLGAARESVSMFVCFRDNELRNNNDATTKRLIGSQCNDLLEAVMDCSWQ